MDALLCIVTPLRAVDWHAVNIAGKLMFLPLKSTYNHLFDSMTFDKPANHKLLASSAEIMFSVGLVSHVFPAKKCIASMG